MSSSESQSEFTLQAVFTVCSSSEVLASVATACAEVPGAVFVGEFQEYFDESRRVQFSDNVLNATGAIALIDCDRDPERALSNMKALHAAGPRNLKVVGMGTAVGAEFLLRAMRCGCNEFLPKPLGAETLQETLRHFQSVHLTHTPHPAGTGHIVSLVGAKGGVGTTTLAVHLANNLVRRHRKHVLLIDHHHELGHVALLLGMKHGQYYFDDLLRNVSRLDGDLLDGFVTRHPSGLDVLTSPDSCTVPHNGTAEEIKKVLSFLRSRYDYVLIDSSMTLAHSQLPILEASDEVFIVSTPDVAALRDLARRVEHLALTETQADRLRIVINRATSEDAVSPEQVEAAVRYPVWITIPNNYLDLVRAINAGEPISAEHRSSFAQHISRWGHKLVNGSIARVEKPKAEKKTFSFWRKAHVPALGGNGG